LGDDFEREAIDRFAIGVSLGLGDRVAVEGAPFLPFGVVSSR
jgi:hypothetical protein